MRLHLLRIAAMACSLVVGFGAASVTAADKTVTLYTEEFPPYSFYGDDGALQGIAVEAVTQIMAASGLAYEIRLLPWARTYREAMKDKQGLIFSLARSKVRENQFDWLALLAVPEFYLYGRADDNRLVSTRAIQRGDFTAVCEDIDASCMILLEAGFPRDRLFNRGDGSNSETTMIEYGRIDFYLGDIHHHPFRMKQLGLDEGRTKPVFKVGEGLSLYLAAGKHVDQDIRTKVKAVYERLIKDSALSRR